MPILVQDIVDRCESALDAEGFERYQFDNDFKPAINYAKEWLVAAFNRAFSDNKLSEESMRELVKVRVWVASTYSRITFNEDETGDKLWSIFAVYPDITYAGSLVDATNPDLTQSSFCPLASYIKSYKSAKRLTLEEVNQNRLNPFATGNEVNVCPDTMEYAYTFAVDYTGAYSTSPAHELEVYPSVAGKPVAMAYLKFPDDIDDESDYLPFPETMTNLVVNKALEWISYKQGDNTTLKMVSDEDVRTLVQLMA